MSGVEPARVAGVQGSIGYLSPSSRTNRRYVSPKGCINLCTYVQHDVLVRDARAVEPPPTLDSHGFMLVDQSTRLTDFKDKAKVEGVYLPEVQDLVKAIVGADQVFIIAWMLRSAAADRGDAQPPSNDLHVDYTPDLADWVVRTVLERAGLEPSSFKRFLTLNHWRPLTAPPQDWPLALCDGSSVGSEEGVAYGIVHVDALPDPATVPEVLPEDPTRPRSLDISYFRFAPHHRWFYFPHMTTREVLLFKNSDSAKSGAWRVPHASFRDPSCPDTIKPRESIEVRTLACFR
jgi:hypothetical protein